MDNILTDPIEVKLLHHNFFDRRVCSLLNDVRDLVFIHLSLKIIVSIIPFALFLFICPNLYWLVYVVYLIILLIFFLGPFMLMLHNICHRKLFKKNYGYLNKIIPWLLGIFFGQTPETYFHHHIAMHHPENNESDDLSSTMTYQRDSAQAFIKYLVSFYFTGVASLVLYFTSKGRNKFALRIVLGEIFFILLSVVLSFYNFKATLTVFILPLLFIRFAMMAGNWAQHAFIDAYYPENIYRNSITCINTIYNKKCFNDGYHIGHHLRPHMHWTQMPLDFLKNIHLYQINKAIVFSGIGYFQIWFLLMTKNYKKLATHFVHLSERENEEDIIRFLKSRTMKIDIT